MILALLLAVAQDQQLGARTKAMGGSYTAFEDDPVSVWLNPGGISSQPNSVSVVYQTYTTYPLHEAGPGGGGTTSTSAEAETSFVDPVLLPSYLGAVFQVGTAKSPMAVGVCYARPYHLNYSFDKVSDPFQTVFDPDSNMEQSFSRLRVAFAKDFLFAGPDEGGFLTHVSVAVALDAGFETWEFNSPGGNRSDNATGFGGGLGLLVGVYDIPDRLKLTFGAAWQSGLKWDFNVEPDLFPAFNMPQQVNVGLSAYILEGLPLRATVDVQWIEWSETADAPLFAGKNEFEDVVNVSFGLEVRVPLDAVLTIYPRAGVRRFDAPWSDADALPATSDYQLVLDTDDEVFTIFTFGLGLTWLSAESKVRSIDVAGDVGGDAYNLAMGFTYEF
ncbi:MAG TPA: hypothetical protein VF950_21520 [Planctomycetota bacterium]